mgnify:FL=1
MLVQHKKKIKGIVAGTPVRKKDNANRSLAESAVDQQKGRKSKANKDWQSCCGTANKDRERWHYQLPKRQDFPSQLEIS